MVHEDYLKLEKISVKLQTNTILSNISLDLQANEIMTIIGPNGAGKTTLIRVILGLQPYQKGIIWKKKGLRIGYMPQKINIQDSMPLRVKDFLRLTNATDSLILKKLNQAGVEYLFNASLHKLSGGELQRVLLARAMLIQPSLLVLDEPAQGVDIQGQYQLYQLISQYRDRYHCAVLIVSHDLHLVMAATDKVICINQHVCCQGSAHQVQKHPAYLKLFAKSIPDLAVYQHNHDHHHDLHGKIIQDK